MQSTAGDPKTATDGGPFAGLRVLDLADESGALAGKLMGDLGADVIAVEPPGGLRARTIGPFWHDESHPDRSLFHWYYGTSKRSVVLDLGRPERSRSTSSAMPQMNETMVEFTPLPSSGYRG